MRSNNHTPRSRRSESHERGATPQQQQQRERRPMTPQNSTPNPDTYDPSAISLTPPPSPSPPRNGRQRNQPRSQTPLEFELISRSSPEDRPVHNVQTSMSPEELRQDALGVGYAPPVQVQPPRLTVEIPRQAATVFPLVQTFAHSNGHHSRSSIAKIPFSDDPTYNQQPLRSIFPTYNPELSLNQQTYGPTQTSPTRVPRAIISRQSYYDNAESSQNQATVRSPGYACSNAGPYRRAAARSTEPPVIPNPSTTEILRDLWKVTNGWKASGTEGRVYCLKLAQQKDAPIYTLSSASSQPFYNLRLDPTSASAYISLTRHDPSKPYKPSKTGTASNILNNAVGGGNRESRNWQEALSTTLEEESRKHRPNDGLVALLMPAMAARIALERADDPVTVAAAERECARLVWDDDSDSHFLVHPALATPFCVTIERSPAWSRVEYTLEHHESPQHVAKLTRDGAGNGWLEIDTGIASKIESFYLIDVAVTTLLLVAAAEDRKSPAAVVETFEAPPVPEAPRPERSLSSALSRHRDATEEQQQQQNKKQKKNKSKKDKKKPAMEQFEMDLESQDESLGKGSRKGEDPLDKLPFLLRIMVKTVKGLFNFIVWLLTIVFKCFSGVFKVFFKCIGSKY